VKNNQFKIKDMFSGEERTESFVFNKWWIVKFLL
jgi:hypothetical protein